MPARTPKPRKLTVVRYYLPNGTRTTKDAPGAKKRKEKTRQWYARLPGDPKPTSLGTEDEGEAWVQLRRLLRERADRAAGIVDDVHRHAVAPLEAHVAAWQAVLRAKGTDDEHITTMGNHVRKLASLAGWSRLCDVTAESTLHALARLRDEARRSTQTRNHYLSHLKQFCRWCCYSTPRRLRDNPVCGIRPQNAEQDPVRPHRLPEEDEVRVLFAWLMTGRAPEHPKQHTTYPSDGSAPVRRFMGGPHRALAYRLAMATGLRANEIRSLRAESFDLGAGTVTVTAGYSKRRRRDTQPIPEWLLPELREHFGSGDGDWRRLNEGGDCRSKNVFRADLEDAGLEYETPEGFLTLHSLRVWYITRLAENPANTVKVVMELARHSTPYLTLKIYARLRRADMHAAVDQLADPTAPAEPSGQKRSG